MPIHTILPILTPIIRQEKEINQKRRSKTVFFFFFDDTILCFENHKLLESTLSVQLQTIQSVYKKSIMFLYTNNKISEKAALENSYP